MHLPDCSVFSGLWGYWHRFFGLLTISGKQEIEIDTYYPSFSDGKFDANATIVASGELQEKAGFFVLLTSVPAEKKSSLEIL